MATGRAEPLRFGAVTQESLGNLKELKGMRAPTYACDKKFTHIPGHVRQDLETLNRV